MEQETLPRWVHGCLAVGMILFVLFLLSFLLLFLIQGGVD
jgi:hypothetical protein